MALISGPGATGKSELLRRFSDHARQEGALVLTTFGSRAETDRPLGLLLQLFQTPGLPPEAADEVRRLVPLADGDPSRLETELCALLLCMARDRSVVLAIDDVQYADPESLAALLYIQRRIASARGMMVITKWGHPGAEQQAFDAELTRLPRCTRLRLAPLTAEAVTERVREALGDVPPHVPDAFATISGGNPLLLSALIEDYRTARNGEGEPVVPVAGPIFVGAVVSCFDRWGPQVREVLSGLALLGDSASPATLSQLLGTDRLTVQQVVEALKATGIVRDGRYCHPAVREAALQALVPHGGPELYRRAAVLLYDEGASASEVARHLIAAGTADDLPWAVDILQRAAGQALNARDLTRAVDCLDLTMRTCGDEQTRAAAMVALARVRFLVNPSAVTALVGRLRGAVDKRRIARPDAALYARCLLWRSEALTGGQVHGLRPESVVAGDHRLGLDARMAEGWLRHTFHGERGESDRTADLARHVARGIGDEQVRAAEHVLQRATVHGTPVEAVLTALFILQHGGRAAEASQWCAVLSEQAERLGADTWAAMLADFQAEAYLNRCDPAAAEVHARRALALLPPQAWGWAIGAPSAHLLMAMTWQGKNREPEAEALASTAPPAGVANTRYLLDFLRARGHYHLSHNRAYAALADFETCGAAAVDWDLDVPALVPWRADAAHALIALNRRDTAKELLAAELARPGGATAMAREAASRLQTAAAGGPRVPRSRLASGPMAHRQERSGPDRPGAAGRTVHLLTPAVHPEPSLLSQAEQRVATLAARGYTNREISRRLYITISTVEQHLTRVYRKLNVRRADLAADLTLQSDSA